MMASLPGDLSAGSQSANHFPVVFYLGTTPAARCFPRPSPSSSRTPLSLAELCPSFFSVFSLVASPLARVLWSFVAIPHFACLLNCCQCPLGLSAIDTPLLRSATPTPAPAPVLPSHSDLHLQTACPPCTSSTQASQRSFFLCPCDTQPYPDPSI